MMCLGRPDRFPEDIMQFAEDIGRRAALAMDNARALRTSRRRPTGRCSAACCRRTSPEVPGLDYRVVYEPAGETNEVGGDFYDLFAAGDDSWRFAIGDVCGTGPEAAAVTGLARHTLRLLAREGYGVAAVLGRLNQAILEEGERARFLTLLHGEITPVPTGLDVRAGVRRASRGAAAAARAAWWRPWSTSAVAARRLPRGDLQGRAGPPRRPATCCSAVTDGVTERRAGGRLLDDDGGLAKLLAECAGLSARAVAERIRRAVQDFAPEPSTDDLAIVVLRAR